MSYFDTTDLNYAKESAGNNLTGSLPLKDFSLPFENCFIKICELDNNESFIQTSIFIKEDSPNLLSGELIFSFIMCSKNKRKIEGKLPFIIYVEQNLCKYSIDEKIYNMYVNKFAYNKIIWEMKLKLNLLSKENANDNINSQEQLLKLITSKELAFNNLYKAILEYATISALINVQEVFEKLSRCEILVDNAIGTEYYSIKGEKTKKVTNRPIYYVIDNKTYSNKSYNIIPITKLEYSHAFRVRGHWRKIDEKSIGKDRGGDYHIKGFTWVIDHLRGQGELVKRTRVIK